MNEFINQWKLREARFLLRRQTRNFENVTLVARQREHFCMFLVIILLAQLPTKRGVLVHKNSLASCQWCCHSVEPRALMCPFIQFKLRASSLSSWVTPSHDWDYTAALLLNVCCLFVCLFFKWFRLKSAQSCQVWFFAFIHQGACAPCSLWNWIGVVQFLTQEVWYDKGLVIQHFLHYCLVQIVLLWSLSVGVRIFFTTNDLVDRIRNLKLNASQNDLKNIMKKMRRRPDFSKNHMVLSKAILRVCARESLCVWGGVSVSSTWNWRSRISDSYQVVHR